jgi:hypothetical protein
MAFPHRWRSGAALARDAFRRAHDGHSAFCEFGSARLVHAGKVISITREQRADHRAVIA